MTAENAMATLVTFVQSASAWPSTLQAAPSDLAPRWPRRGPAAGAAPELLARGPGRPALVCESALGAVLSLMAVGAALSAGGGAARPRRRRRRHVAGRAAALQDSEIVSAMTLPPEALAVKPAEEADTRDTRRELTGGWLGLFRNSAPYIAMFRSTVMVFHIPGHLLEPARASELEGLLGDITLCTLLGVRPVVVVSAEQRIVQRAVDEGLFTSSGASLETLPASQDVLRLVKEEVGIVLAEVEGVLDRLGHYVQGRRRSVGPSLALGRKNHDEDTLSFSVFSNSMLCSASPFRTEDGVVGGILGRIYKVDTVQIHRRLQDNDIVVLMPIGICSGGEVRCVRSEKLATEVAKQMRAAKLVFFTQGQRIVDMRRRGLPVATIQVKDASAWLAFAKRVPRSEQDNLTKEVLNYVGLLVEALSSGTRRGHLLDCNQGSLLQELYTSDGRGTMVSKDLYDGIRLASSGDVLGIMALMQPLMQKGLLKQRSGYEVERACRNGETFVWKRDDETLGCANLVGYEDAPDTAELGCFIISPSLRGKGHGTVLLAFIERVAVLQGLRKLYLLTTQTMQWFEERGFRPTTVDQLPASKRKNYDSKRSSKVYVKSLDDLSSQVRERFSFVEVDALD